MNADRAMLAWLRAGAARNEDGASIAEPPVERGLPGSPLECRISAPATNGRKSSLGRLGAELLQPHRASLAIILFATVLETAMSLAAPWPLKIVLDNVIAGHRSPGWLREAARWIPVDGAVGIAAVAAIAVVIIAVLGGLASYVESYYTESVGQRVASDLRVRVYRHLEHLSLAYHDTHPSAALLSTITDDVATVQDFASSKAMGMVVDLLTIAGMLGLMFWLKWDFTLVVVAVAPLLVLFVGRFKKAVKEATREVRRRQSEIMGVVQQGLQSIRVVTAFGREELEEKRLVDASREAVQAALKTRRVKSLLSPVVKVTVAVCIALILWRGGSLVRASAMTAGSLTVFLSYLAKFFKPVQDVAKMSGALAQAAVGLERVYGILDIDMSIPERPAAREPGELAGAVEFDHVAFAYQPAVPVLKDVSISIAAGQFVGIVGATGTGKSTLASLIPRFYDATAGRVLIDGVDVRDYKLRSLRDQIGFVLQDALLFRGTVRDNIAYGRPDASDEKIVEAARLANAHDFIVRMPEGYDTQVGEKGVTLSGGEQQRIEIARAIVRNAPILILDEPTAALDSESEKLVLEALHRLMKGRTVITIAHRLSTIRDADKIIVLKDGRVAEQGKHDELLALGGVYSKLYRIQAGAGPTIGSEGRPQRNRGTSVFPIARRSS